MTELSDERLIESCLEGSREHARLLYERHASKIECFIAVRVRNSEATKDLVQETFVKAFGKLGKLRKKSSFRTWLFKIAENACNSHFRKIKRERGVFSNPMVESEDGELLEMPDPDPGPSPGALLRQKELKVAMKETLSRLPDKQRTVMLLWCEGFSYAEISEITKDPRETVGTQIFYAKEKMRKALKNHR